MRRATVAWLTDNIRAAADRLPCLATFRRKIQPGWPVGRIGL
jgi:hypothetical protein